MDAALKPGVKYCTQISSIIFPKAIFPRNNPPPPVPRPRTRLFGRQCGSWGGGAARRKDGDGGELGQVQAMGQRAAGRCAA